MFNSEHLETQSYSWFNKTKDGFVAVLPYSDEQWLRFFKLVGKEEILKDTRFSTLKSRNENIDLLYQLLSSELTKKETEVVERYIEANSTRISLEELNYLKCKAAIHERWKK